MLRDEKSTKIVGMFRVGGDAYYCHLKLYAGSRSEMIWECWVFDWSFGAAKAERLCKESGVTVEDAVDFARVLV